MKKLQRYWDSNLLRKYAYCEISLIELISTLIMAVGIALIFSPLQGAQHYNDFIYGYITEFNLYKTGDFIQIAITLALWAIGLFTINSVFNYLKSHENGKATILVIKKMVFIFICPTLFFIFNAVLTNSIDFTGAIISACLMLVFIISTISLLVKFGGSIKAETYEYIISSTIALIILAALVSITPMLLFSRISVEFFAHTHLHKTLIPAAITSIVILYLIFSYIRAKQPAQLKNRLYKALIVCQLPIPLLLLSLIPPLIEINGETTINTMYSIALPISVSIIVGILLLYNTIFLISTFKKGEFNNAFSYYILGGTVVCALIYFFVSQNIPMMGKMPINEYETGKIFLSWHQYLHFGKIPYYDLNYAHGLSQLLFGFVNWLFFRGNVGTLNQTHIIITSIYISIIFIFAKHSLNKGLSALVCFLPATLIISPIFLLANKKIIDNTTHWLWLWALSSFMIALFQPSIGVPIVLGTIPFFIYQAYTLRTKTPTNSKNLITLIAAIICICLLLLVSGKMIIGLLEFLSDNASDNSIIWGIRFNNNTHTIMSALRLSWVLTVGYSLVILWSELDKPTTDRSKKVLFLASFIPLSAITAIPYALGRIDPMSATRTGFLSILMALVLIGLIYSLKHIKTVYVTVIALFIIALSNHVGGIVRAKPISNFFRFPYETIFVNNKTDILPARNKNIKNLSWIKTDPLKIKRLLNLKTFLNKHLKKHETFLDLSNRGMDYYYLNYEIPVKEINAQNMSPSKLQFRIINELKNKRPPIILITPGIS